MNLSPDAVIDGYRVVRHIATGSMGRVYEVVHEVRGTRHALKTLPLANQQQRARIEREARALQELSHPGIVELVEVFFSGNDPVLIMEYAEGRTLRKWIDAGPRTSDEVQSTFAQIATAVAHAHRHGVIHRDLRPDNVMVADDGSVKVLDFGLSKLAEPQGTALTDAEVGLGAVCYSAPEQINDAASVDSRADVFSLGCLLYEMSTGRRPFDARNPLDLTEQILACRYDDPLQIRPELPTSVAHAIEHSLVARREDRIESAEDLLALLGVEVAATSVPAASRKQSPTQFAAGPDIAKIGVVAAIGLFSLTVAYLALSR